MQCNLIRSNVVPPRFPELQNPLTEAIKKTPLRQFQGKCVNKRTKSPMETEAKKIEMNRARGVGAWSEGKWLKVHLQTIGPTNPDSLPQSVCHGFSILCPNYPDPDLLVYLRLRLRLYFAHCLLVPRLHLTSVLGPLSSFFFLPVGQSLGEFMLCVCVCVCGTDSRRHFDVLAPQK